MGFASDVLNELKPTKRPELAWCFCFLPSLIAYVVVLSNFINTKPRIGEVFMYHEDLRVVVNPDSHLEVILSGVGITDGPLWIDDIESSMKYLLFSEVDRNRILRWEEGKGLFTVGKSLYLNRSGCHTAQGTCGDMNYSGSTGLLKLTSSKTDFVVACQYGTKSISLIYGNGTRLLLADSYLNRPFNSPHDLTLSKTGNIYFTDPVYRSDNLPNQPGIYMISKEDLNESIRTKSPTLHVKLLSNNFSSPLGVAMSPDGGKLYVTNVDVNSSYIAEIILRNNSVNKIVPSLPSSDVSECGGELDNVTTTTSKSRTFSPSSSSTVALSGGVKVDHRGNIYAAVTNGVLIMSANWTTLGLLHVGVPVTNVALGDGYLYISCHGKIVRIRRAQR